MPKQKKIIIAFCCLLATLIGAWGGFFVIQMRNKNANYKLFPTEYDNLKIIPNQNIVIATKDKKEIVLSLDNNIIDANNENGTIAPLYNDYYFIVNNNEKILKRNGQVISSDKETIIRDENDLNSEYISINYDYSNLVNNENIRILKDNNKYSIYNSKTGVVLAENINTIYKLLNNNEQIGIIIDYGNKYGILTYTDSQVYDLAENLEVVSDTIDYYGLNNSNYMVVKDTNSKHGVINLKGEVIIEPTYDNLYFTDSNDYLTAVKNGEYGLINITNETLIEFNYQGIETKGNYIIVLGTDKTVIKDLELKTIKVLEDTITYTAKNNKLKTTVINDILIIQLKNTYLLNNKELIGTIEGLTTVIDNPVTKEQYLIKDDSKSNTATITIYDLNAKLINSYESHLTESIMTTSFVSVKENIVRINLYNQDIEVIDSILYNITTDNIWTADIDFNYGILSAINDKFYINENHQLIIYNRDLKELKTISGKALYYLNKDTYALINTKDKYQLLYLAN